MSKAEDLPYHQHPEIEDVSIAFMFDEDRHWDLKLKGQPHPVRISAKQAINYEKFRAACADQLMVVFQPMSQADWATLLRNAVYEARRRKNPPGKEENR